jgi:hypothetical protein
VAAGQQVVGMDVVAAQAPLAQPARDDTGQQRVEVPRAGALAHLHQHPQGRLLHGLLQRARLVIGTDARRRVGQQPLSRQPRRVAVHRQAAPRGRVHLGQHARVAAQYRGEVHDLGQAVDAGRL